MFQQLLRVSVVVSCLAVCAFAQRDLATVLGTVTDPQGAVVPSAKVTITEDATGLSYEVTTDTNGEFIRPLLKPGIYTVTVEASGFKKGVQKNVELTAGGRIAVPITLAVGEITQVIEIQAVAPLLQTESTVLGKDLNSRQASELPLGGTRVFAFLARLSPGVVPPEPGARDEAGGGFSANGVRSNGQNNFLLNGVDNNVNVIDFLNQTAYVVGPSVEAIGEMTILTNGYNAEYGRGAGGVVNVQLKSGTNDLHGTLFEFLQNEDLNANTWENNKNGAARGAYKQNQFGAAVGGPVIKNKLFIFGDYQGTRIRSNSQALNLGIGGDMTLPTPKEIQGDFSQLLSNQVLGTDPLGNPIYAGEIYDPASTTTVNGQLTRTPFPGNKIPQSRFDPASAKIMALFPSPNTAYPTSGFPQNDYFIVTPVPQGINQGDGRVDYHISDKDTLFGSMSWSDRNQTNGQPLPGALDATYFASQQEVDLARNAMLSWTRVWSPKIISETRVAFTRLVTSRIQGNANTDEFKAFGIGGYDPTTTLNGGLPSISLGRYSGIGASDWLPSKEFNNVWDFIENVSITHGSHASKFGAEFRPIKFPFFQVPSPHGDMYISRNDTAFPNANNGINNNTGDEMASFLLGVINGGQISTNNFISSEKWAWAFFGQDDWKITPKLTLNLGLRYELFSPIGERFGQQSNFLGPQVEELDIPKGKSENAPLPPSFDPGGTLSFIKVCRGCVDRYLIPSDKLDFSPRIGIAYQLRPSTVVRLAYGTFYGGEENQGGYPNRGEAVPFNETVQLNRNGLGPFDPNPFFSGGVTGGFPSNVFTLDVPPAFRGVSKNFRNSLVHKWNIAVQHELGHDMALEVSYVGNHQAHQVIIWDPNICPNNPNPNVSCDSTRIVPALGGLSFVDSFGFGNYAGMTTKFEKRYSHGLNFSASYTYGHALADTGTTLTGSYNQSSKNTRNIAQGYSSAAWDIRHSLVMNFIYDLPFGRGRRWLNNMGPVSWLVGNWQVNSIMTFRTGAPFTLGTTQCVGTFGSCQPDVVPGKDPKNAPPGGRRPEEWWDTSAVTAPTPGTPGNLGLQSNNQPGQRIVDFSLFKDFRFTERYKMQFRAEAFNLANTPQWGGQSNGAIDVNQGDPAFGQILATQPNTQRHVQFALRFMF